MELSGNLIVQLLETIKKQDRVMQLNANNNSLVNKDMIPLKDYLVFTTSLVSLDISKNKISNLGAISLCQGLTAVLPNTRLKRLDVSSNMIKNEGGIHLAKAIEVLTGLNYFKADTNYFTEVVIDHFFRAVTKNPELIYCHINSGSIRDEAQLDKLEFCLKKNKELNFQLKKKQRDLLKRLNTAYKAKGEWNRCKLMIIGEGRAGKTSLVRNFLSLPFLSNLDSTVIGEISNVNVRAEKGWENERNENEPLDHSLGLSIKLVKGLTANYKTELIEGEKNDVLQTEKKENEDRLKIEAEEERKVAEFKKDPNKFRKLSPNKKRELRDMLKRVNERKRKKEGGGGKGGNKKKDGIILLNKENIKTPIYDIKKERKPGVLKERDIDFTELTLDKDRNKNEDKTEEFIDIRKVDMSKMPLAERKKMREKLKNQRTNQNSVKYNLMNSKKINDLLSNDTLYQSKLNEVPQIKFNIWDLGGQEVFHSILHLFITECAIYVIVIDLRKFCNSLNFFSADTSEEKERKVAERHLKHWLKTLNLKVPTSKIMIIGTFLDEIEIKTLEEGLDINKILHEIDSNLVSSLELLSEKDKRIIKNYDNSTDSSPEAGKEREKLGNSLYYYPVDNKYSNGILKVKRVLEKVAKQQDFIKTSFELRWLSILDNILEINQLRFKKVELKSNSPDQIPVPPQPAIAPVATPAPVAPVATVGLPVPGVPGAPVPVQAGGESLVNMLERMREKNEELFCGYITLDDIIKRCNKVGITSEREIISTLETFHKLGAIFYLSSSQNLKEIITIDIKWLILTIGKVIRDKKLHQERVAREKNEIEKRGLSADVELMLNKGIVSYDLLEYYFGKRENTKFLVSLMTCTYLIGQWKKDTYLVPCLLPNDQEKYLACLKDYHQAHSRIKFKFKKWEYPHGIFERIICLLVSLKDTESGSEEIEVDRKYCRTEIEKGNGLLVIEDEDNTEILLSFESTEDKVVNQNVLLLDKLLLKIKTELQMASLNWNILVSLKNDEFKQYEKKDINTTQTEDFNLAGFLDGV